MKIIAISFIIVLVAVMIVFGALLIALAHLVLDNKDKDNNRNN